MQKKQCRSKIANFSGFNQKKYSSLSNRRVAVECCLSYHVHITDTTLDINECE